VVSFKKPVLLSWRLREESRWILIKSNSCCLCKEADIEAFLDKLTGRDLQAEHDGMVRDEHAAIAGQEASVMDEDNPFSLAPDGGAFQREVSALEQSAPLGKNGRPLAPNGKESKLTLRQWATVRTAAFKNWFGDWQGAEIKKFLEGPAVEELTGDEFAWQADKPLSQRVAAWFDQQFGNTVSNPETGAVDISIKGVKSSWFHGPSAKKAAAFAAVPAIISKGRIVRRQPNYKHGVERVILVAPVLIGGEAHTGIVVIQKTNHGQRFYLHEVFMQKEMPQTSSTAGESAGNGSHTGTDAEALASIVQGLHSVNSENVSKVVDENGEPLVVWHGGREFDAFNESPDAGSHYASSDMEAAQTFADQYGQEGEVKPLFLNLRNPLPLEEMPRSGSKEITEAKAAGHDGIEANDTDASNRGAYQSFAFWNSTQAKNAGADFDSVWGTSVNQQENNGGFSSTDPRTAFSLAPSAWVDSLSVNVAGRVKDPKARMAIFTRLLEKLGDLKRDRDELGIAFGKGYKRKAIEDPRQSASIRRERVNNINNKNCFLLESP
jgi:hypothetical protein